MKIGKKILQIVMGDNYHNPMVVYREYIQNACDALYRAAKDKVLADSDEKYISIEINEFSKSVSFFDRGIGVKSDQIVHKLGDIGDSDKDGIEDIGNYGIGRLVGAHWCDEIIFETSYKGEGKKSKWTFNSKEANRLIAEDNDLDCASIMDAVTSFTSFDEKEDDHYFRVTLNNVNERLLNKAEVEQFLQETAPVGFTYNFSNSLFNPALKSNPDYRALFENEKKCFIVLKGGDEEIEIEKAYAPNVDFSVTEQQRLQTPIFFQIDDPDYGRLAWGWYSITETAKQMNDLPYRGIRLRKHNMAVGSYDILNKYFPKPVDANYFVGELYIANDNIRPSGSRDGLKPSIEFDILEAGLRKKFKELKKNYETISRLGSSALSEIIESYKAQKTNAIILKDQSRDEEDRGKAKEEIKKAKDSMEKANEELGKKLKDISKNPDLRILAEGTVKYYGRKSQHEISDVNAKIKNGEDKISYLDLGEYVKKHSISSNNSQFKSEDSDSGTSETNSPSDYPESSEFKSDKVPVETDVFKSLGKAEWQLMKKVYKVLESDSRLDPNTLSRLKKKLVKKLVGNDA